MKVFTATIVAGMGKAVAVYVRDADLKLWALVEQYAQEHRMAVSAVVMTAVERFLAEQGRTVRESDVK